MYISFGDKSQSLVPDMLVQIHGINQHPDVRHIDQLRRSRLLYLSITDDGGTWKLEVGTWLEVGSVPKVPGMFTHVYIKQTKCRDVYTGSNL